MHDGHNKVNSTKINQLDLHVACVSCALGFLTCPAPLWTVSHRVSPATRCTNDARVTSDDTNTHLEVWEL